MSQNKKSKIGFYLLLFQMIVFNAQSQISQKNETPKVIVTKNDFREALKPVPETAVFKMDGYYLWDPSVIEVNGIYHLFASRWPESEGSNGWVKSEIIRATSNSLFGPYKFQEVVLKPSNHPWATKGCHNPKIMKSGNRFLLYYLGIPVWKTGFAFANAITGPWTIVDHPVIPTNNPAICQKPDGKAYAVGKILKKDATKKVSKFMEAYESKTIDGPYTLAGDTLNRLPGDCQLEDPTIWWANNQYNVVCTDWESKATGIWKALVYYVSKDGINYQLYSQLPLWNRSEPIPLSNGSELKVSRVERPQVYVDNKGSVKALLVSVEPKEKGSSFIIIRPVADFYPKNK